MAEKNAPENNKILFYRHLFQSSDNVLKIGNIQNNSSLIEKFREETKAIKVSKFNKSVYEDISNIGIKDAKIIIPIYANNNIEGFIILGQKKSQAPYNKTDYKIFDWIISQTPHI
jgi:hypothetical protein